MLGEGVYVTAKWVVTGSARFICVCVWESVWKNNRLRHTHHSVHRYRLKHNCAAILLRGWSQLMSLVQTQPDGHKWHFALGLVFGPFCPDKINTRNGSSISYKNKRHTESLYSNRFSIDSLLSAHTLTLQVQMSCEPVRLLSVKWCGICDISPWGVSQARWPIIVTGFAAWQESERVQQVKW